MTTFYNINDIDHHKVQIRTCKISMKTEADIGPVGPLAQPLNMASFHVNIRSKEELLGWFVDVPIKVTSGGRKRVDSSVRYRKKYRIDAILWLEL